MRTSALATLPLALLLAACGAGEGGAGGTSAAPSAGEPRLYEADALVLDDGVRGPMLCLGAVAESYPPQCGDVPLAGWDWAAVEGEESASGTIWGEYHVVGAYDGETFTLTEAGPVEEEPPSGDAELETPCPEPEGGWAVVDPSRVSEEDFAAAAGAAEREPDSVAVWVDYAGDPSPEELDQQEGGLPLQILNAAFAGDRERHEQELRALWGGPLCVSVREGATAGELERIRAEAEAAVTEELGLRFLWSSASQYEGVVEIGVVADPGGAGRAALDERFGAGLVRLVPALRPVQG
jgi:hypothetical protein